MFERQGLSEVLLQENNGLCVQEYSSDPKAFLLVNQ